MATADTEEAPIRLLVPQGDGGGPGVGAATVSVLQAAGADAGIAGRPR